MLKEIDRMDIFTCDKLKMDLKYKICRANFFLANFTIYGSKDLPECMGCKEGEKIYNALDKQDKARKLRDVRK